MKKILFPLIKAGSGSDIFTNNLQSGLKKLSIVADIQYIPHIYGIFPTLAGKKCDYSGCDIIHTNTWNGYAFKNNLPLVTTEHHIVHDPLYLRNSGPIQRSYYRLIYKNERKSLDHADIVTCVSRHTQKKLKEIFGYSDSRLIYNGIDTQIFKPEPISQEKYNIPENKTILLFVGNLSYRKGADLLIPIMKNLGDDFILLITSGLRSHGDFNQDNIINMGRLSRKNLVEAYNLCDIFLFPSRLEGFGLSVVEAMACAKPVITSNCSSLPELVIDDKGGILCECDNIQKFTRSIKYLSEDPVLRKKQGEFNRCRVTNNFSIEHMSKQYAKLYGTI